MTTMNEELDKNYQSPPREEIIQTAVKFLKNPNVVHTPLAQKQKFLQRKGLSNEEIQIACERSGAYTYHDSQERLANGALVPPQVSYYNYNRNHSMQVTLFDKIREIVHNIAIFSTFAYVVYKFYEKYIRPYLFGIKKKSVEESIDELKKTVDSSVIDLKDSLSSVQVEVDQLSKNSAPSTQRQLELLQTDVATVKGILLSRKQFPSVSNSPVVPPSIPAWQMSSAQSEHSEPEADPKSEDLMEIASGASSDPEHATKTSDSSLEIIYTTN